ncbi:MAG: cytochrome b561 [Colwellia sp.]|jgi:cytochrome b561
MIRNKLLWKNNPQQYGILSKLLHWLSALAIFALFASGYWMVDLDYSSRWYQLVPHWHESIGILLLGFTLFRLFWRRIAGSPSGIVSHSAIEKKASASMIFILYVTLFIVLISGFLISSANEKAIAVFDWFNVTPVVLAIKNQEDIAGKVHYYVAYAMIIFALVHALAALKHHFVDKDNTLKRMTKT